ncbi:MAG: response regulator [Ferruginibacter sp.]|nr:response regulator [Ferruginibacter sp.]
MLSKKDYKIYLLDEDVFYMNIFQQQLVNLGYTDITAFHEAAKCLENLNPPPDIIFYDDGIDFVKGLEVLKMIKRHNPDIFMIYICGQDDVDTVVQSLKYGVFDYFVKGENDMKNIEMVLTKVSRVKDLLQKNNVVRFKNFDTVPSVR